MGQCKKDVTPLLTHWSYVFLALTHRNDSDIRMILSMLVVIVTVCYGNRSSIFDSKTWGWISTSPVFSMKDDIKCNCIFFTLSQNNSVCKGLTGLLLRTEYSWITLSVSWLLMTWLLESPEHQHQWHWPCMWILVIQKEGFKPPAPYLIFKGWWKMQIYFYVLSKQFCMMMSSNGNIFRVNGHLCGEFTGHRWIPRTKASDAELWCFLWSVPE